MLEVSARSAGVPPARGRRAPLLLVLLTLAGTACQSDPGPVVAEVEGRDLGRDAFVPDDVEDAADAGFEDVDLADVDVTADAGVGVGDPCTLLDVDSCPSGLKCVPRFDGAGECRPLADPAVPLGEPCGRRGYDDCQAGALCVSPDEETGLRCFLACDADTDAGQTCGDGATCSERLALLVEPVGVCL